MEFKDVESEGAVRFFWTFGLFCWRMNLAVNERYYLGIFSGKKILKGEN